MRFLINLFTGDTLTKTSETTMTDTKGNVWNKSGSTWHDSHGNTIQPLQDNISTKQNGSLFNSWSGNNDF